MNSARVLVFSPAYNEEKTVGEVVKGVLKRYPDFDMVVIDDGSMDKTRIEAEAAGARVISLPFHTGGTTAVITAYLIATSQDYDFLVKIDADGQHKVEDISRILEPILNGEADISVGSRYLMDNNEKDSSVKIAGRVFSSYILNKLLENILVTDTTSGFRAWNRKALKVLLDEYLNNRRLPNDSVLWLVETIISNRKGLKIKEVPIKVLPRRYGKSKSFSLPKMILYPIRLLQILMEALT